MRVTMRAPYTGVIVSVTADAVEERLARGFKVVGSMPVVEQVDDTPEYDTGEETADESEDAEVPGIESTIPEIRAYAVAHNIELPKKANKAELLAAIEGAI